MTMKFTNVIDAKEALNKIEINKIGNIVYTKFYGRLLKESDVSDLYEVFDFGTWSKSKIDEISTQMNITSIELKLYGGIQELFIYGDEVNISDHKFVSMINIISSSDRSRKLQINYGIYGTNVNFKYITEKGSISKKHLTGLNVHINEKFELDSIIFDELYDLLSVIIDEEIRYSDVRRFILQPNIKKNKIPAVNYEKLRKFNIRIHKLSPYPAINVYNFDDENNDFIIPAFDVFKNYLNIFENKDMYIFKKECRNISKLTLSFQKIDNLSKLMEISL